MSKSIGIKLANGAFYPIMEEGKAARVNMDLTTANDNQEIVHVDLYRSDNNTIENAEYVDTLQIGTFPHPNGEPSIQLEISLDKKNILQAKINDSESGNKSEVTVPLVSSPDSNFASDDDNDDKIDLDNLVFDTDKTRIISNDEESFVDIDLNFDSQPEDIESADNLLSDNTTEIFDEASKDVFDETKTEFNADDDLTDDFFDNALNDFLDNDLRESAIASSKTGVVLKKSAQYLRSTDKPESHLEDYKETKTDDSTAFSVDIDDFPAPQDAQSAETEFGVDFDGDSADVFKNSFSAKRTTDLNDDTVIFPGDKFEFESEEKTETSMGETQSALFSDLYDKNDITEEKTTYYEEKKKKRSGAALLICLLCAIICLAVLLLFLFVIPSRINIRMDDSSEEIAVAETTEAPRDVQEIPDVDQIIFTDKPITIVPIPPQQATQQPPAAPAQPEVQPVQETPPEVQTPPPAESVTQPAQSAKAQPIRYKIKWGDTLWDIAWAYYRNPRLYPVIARYNNIKNPNKIIAGTTILIPPR